MTGRNHGIRALARIMGVGGVGFLIALTIVVLLLSAATQYTLEHGQCRATIISFGEALWWRVATLATVGSEDNAVIPEGRILAVAVMIYSLGMARPITGVFAALLVRHHVRQRTDRIVRGVSERSPPGAVAGREQHESARNAAQPRSQARKATKR